MRLEDDPRPRLLSNNHVLADENRGDVGDEILQLGRLDGGMPASDVIATLERFEKLDDRQVNHVDAALALLADDIELITKIDGVGKPSRVVAAEDVLSVAKVGRTTALTFGTVTAIEVDNVVVDFSTGRLRFDGQIEIAGVDGQPFNMGGDSGSLIADASDASTLGLLFAGSDQGGTRDTGVTYANPLGEVFDRLGVEVVSGVGASLEQARRAKAELSARVADNSVIAGIGLARREGGWGVKVNVVRAAPELQIPADVDGVPVTVEVVGRVAAR